MLGIVAFASIALKPINHVKLPAESREFDFVVLGDNRPAGSGLPPTLVFREIIREVGFLHPAFVLSSGDLVYGNEESIEQYRRECDQITLVLSTLNVPFFNAVGNHEIADRPEFQTEYVKRFGPVFGSFEYGGFQFIGLCTDEAQAKGKLSNSQRLWLNEMLVSSKPSFVFMHRPVFARAGNDEDGATVEGAASIHELFKEHGVQAVFEGHDHVYDRQKHDGVEYIISGGAGAPLDANPENGGYFHFVLVHVKGGKASMSVVPVGAIEITRDKEGVRVANYSDGDLDLKDFPLECSSVTPKIWAIVDNKGKKTEIPVVIERVEKTNAGFMAHLKFKLTKHRQTILSLRYGSEHP